MLRLSNKSKNSFARRLFALTLFVMCCFTAIAQGDISITGTVVDKNNKPVAGATITEPGTQKGTTSDVSGKFTLGVTSLNATLHVTYIGMKPQTVALAGKSHINIIMADGDIQVDELVVTALGVKREAKALGYAVSSINSESLTAGREQNIMSALMGKVAGVDISTTSAGPSGSTRVLIRGNSQLSGSNLPLYVVDGIPVDNTPIGSEVGKNGGYDYGDVLSTINPDDIENITVLKGPSASALYGAGAANGVIMITTKSAKQNSAIGIELSSNVSMVKVLTQFDDYQRVYGMGRNGTPPLTLADAATVAQTAWGGKLDPNYQTAIYNGELRDYGNRNNNIMTFFDTGVTTTNSIAMTGATDKTTFRFSLSDMRNTDIVPKSTMNRTSFTSRGSSRLGKKISIDAQATYTIENVENRPALSDNSSNIGNALVGLAPNMDQKWLAENYMDENGKYYNWNGNDYRFNPYWIINEMRNVSSRNRLMGQARFNWNFTKDLKFSFRGGLDTYSFRATEFIPVQTPRFESGAMNERTMSVTQSNLEAMLTYNKKISDFDITALAGANLMRYASETFFTEAKTQILPGVYDINAFKDLPTTHSNPRKEVRSLFGQVSLGYKGSYYIDATLRNDISSTLAPGNRSYVYPSVSGSIIFSNLFNHGNWLTFGKLRASWANVGGDTGAYGLSLYYDLKTYKLNDVSLGQISSGNIPNLKIKPTDTFSSEIGLDMKFFNNRLGIDLTLYDQTTKDQIMYLPVSKATGFDRALINAGKIRNRGIEVAINGTIVDTKNTLIKTTLTYSKNDNKVLELHPDVKNYELGSARWANGAIYAMENEPYGAIVGSKIKRTEDGQMLLSKAGLPQFEDAVSILGNGNFDYIIGWSTNIGYKNFSLTCVFDAKMGADIYSMSMMNSHYSGTSKATLEGREGWYTSEQARLAANVSPDKWTPTGGYLAAGVKEGPVVDGVQTYLPNETYVNPALYWQSFQNGSPEPFICDASFIKLREMSLSYNLPSKWLRKTPINNASVSIYGRNLFILYSNVKNIDPESTYNNGNGKGFEYGSLPSRRTFGFGVNVKF